MRRQSLDDRSYFNTCFLLGEAGADTPPRPKTLDPPRRTPPTNLSLLSEFCIECVWKGWERRDVCIKIGLQKSQERVFWAERDATRSPTQRKRGCHDRTAPLRKSRWVVAQGKLAMPLASPALHGAGRTSRAGRYFLLLLLLERVLRLGRTTLAVELASLVHAAACQFEELCRRRDAEVGKHD